jgi:hypothetical protein
MEMETANGKKMKTKMENGNGYWDLNPYTKVCH